MTAGDILTSGFAGAPTSGAEDAGLGASLYQQAHFYTVGVFEKYGDPRVSNYHLMRTPWPTIGATLLYYCFVRVVGPRMMRNRKPYEILPLIRVYNLMMAAWNGFGFLTACDLVNYGANLVGCRPVDPNQRDEKTLNLIYYGWMFYTSRLVEFADTVFFVLRKKDSQVTNFHVFHHSSVPTTTWFFLKFAPGGNSGIFPFINTIIHTIMYSYYFLATFPALRPYLGWKKYLTQMQIVQFFIIIACCMQPIFIPGCQFPRALLLIMVGFSFVFILLFVDFYLKAYKKKSAQVAGRADIRVAAKLKPIEEDPRLLRNFLAGDLDNNNSDRVANQNHLQASRSDQMRLEARKESARSPCTQANGQPAPLVDKTPAGKKHQ